MNRNIELYLRDEGKLDIDSKLMNEFGLEISYSISDIEDLGSRKSNYTKSFKLIGTPTNNKLFKHVYDVNFESLTFDMNVTQECYLMLNKNVVIDGYLKIRSINKVFVAGKYQIIYNVNLYDEIKSIFNKLGNKKLTDLDFSEEFTFMDDTYNTGNHIFNLDNIEESQSRIKDYKNVYEYPLINYNYLGEDKNGNNFPNTSLDIDSGDSIKRKGNLDIGQMYPSIYIKSIIDKMFYDIGYTYSSDFFNGISYDEMFTKLVNIYTGEKTLVDNIDYLNIKPAILASESLKTLPAIISGDTSSIFNLGVEILSQVENSGSINVSQSNTIIKSDGNFDFDLKYLIDSYHFGGVNSITFQSFIIQQNDNIIYSKDCYNDIYEDGLIEDNFNIDLKKGDLITFGIIYYYYIKYPEKYHYIYNIVTIPNFYCNIKLNIEDVESKLDTTLLLNEFLPDLTQAEFLKSIINQFNLKITVDKFNEKHLNIQTRQEYYNSGEIIDWNNKVNENNIQIYPTSKKISRYYNFNMGEMDIYYSNQYKNIWNSNYGNKEFDYGSDAVTGINNIDSKFGGYDFKYYSVHNDYIFIPNLVKDSEDNIATKKRTTKPILGFINNHNIAPYKWYFFIPNFESTIELEWNSTNNHWDEIIYDVNNLRPLMTTINTANHVEKFANGTVKYDLNFETKQGTTGYKNSYNNFWKSEVENLTNNNNRIITYNIDLNIEDIIKLDFKNPIIIKNELYYLQKLVTDINSDKSSKVELIKAFDYVNFTTPDVLPLIWGIYNIGSVVASGVNRPVANTTLLDTGYVNEINTENDFTITPNSTIENYFWFATPNQGIYNKKHSWFVDQWNNGSIGGAENLGGNLFPDPITVDYNGNSYNVYVANYQSNIETIKLSYEDSITIG